MNPAALALSIALSAAPPEFLVMAQDAAGESSPELAAAVSRSLVATGATVIMGPPTTELCGDRCVRLTVREMEAGRVRVEARQGRHQASSFVSMAPGASQFERARAIAVQARLMITWPTDEPPPRKAPPPPPPPEPEPPPVAVAPPPEPVPEPEPPKPEPAPAPLPPPVIAPRPERSVPFVPIVLAGAATVVAGGFAVLAADRYGSLDNRALPLAQAEAARDQGKSFQTASLVLGGVAVTSAAIALVLYLAQEGR